MSRPFRLFFLISLALLAACSKDDPPSVAPQNVSASAGESLALIDWDEEPGLTYWIFYREGADVDKNTKDVILYNVKPPYVRSGLTNGTQYAFAVTASKGNSAAGPISASVTATPRLLSPSVPWFEGTSLSANNLNSITYGASTYVTVGDAATVFIGEFSYADDTGVSAWAAPTSLAAGAGTNLRSVFYDGSRFVALGDDGTVLKTTDSDHLVWEAATAISGAPTMNALTVGAGKYVAVGDSGAIYTNTSNGVSAAWTAQDSKTVNNLYAVAYVYDRFIAVGAGGTLVSSTDGVSWTLQDSKTANDLYAIAYGNDLYLVAGDAGTIVTSSDATSWAVQTLASPDNFRSVVYGVDEQFIAVGDAGVVAYSTTGLDGSWSTSNAGSIDLNSLASSSVFIAVGDMGANVSGK